MRLHLSSPRFAAALLAVLVLSGCGGPPSSSDGRKQLEIRIQSESNGLIQLVSFDKTNGMEMEMGGMKVYKMEYTAEIECLENCSWGGGGMFGAWDGHFRAIKGSVDTSGLNGLMAIASGTQGMTKANKGQRTKVKGDFAFMKTEQGWKLAEQ